MSHSPILRLAVPSPLRQLFDYLPPAGVDCGQLQPGVRLRVPFGRRQATAVLIEQAATAQVEPHRLRHARQVLDETPAIPAELLRLLRWTADYYHYPLGETLTTALPTLLRQGEAALPRPRKRWRVTEAGLAVDVAALAKRAHRRAELLQRLLACGETGLTADQLADTPGPWNDTLSALVAKGWAEVEDIATLAPPRAPLDPAPDLNPAQQAAVEAVTTALGRFQPFLLDGVTGSGKTEVYLRLIENVIARGEQVLVLVPEIALTPQLLDRFRRRLSVPLVVLHSALTDRDRLDAWLHARDGRASVVIGTRSAIFTPLARPGLIILDEEHDPSFKQQTGLRYSARDLAVIRARDCGIPLVLGSATPSLESLHNVMGRRYTELRLPERAGAAKPPTVELLDVRRQPMEDQLSAPLLARIERHLDQGGQVLLFLNRRGYAPTLICHECGWIAECPRCDSHMILHQQRGVLHCHHCGREQVVARQCPRCGSLDLRGLGSGTERVEQALQRHFGAIGIARVDRDTTRRRGEMEQIIATTHQGNIRILVGTQMLAKGHHFPEVTLAGVLDGDQGLFGIDFRAGERMAQLIVQVAGRAGRAERAGEVVIQTHHPDHPLLQVLCRDGYHAFAAAALAEREAARLPPYTHLALLRAEATSRASPLAFLEQARTAAGTPQGVELYGPMPSPMERRAGRYRAQLLLQSSQRAPLHRFMATWLEGLAQLPAARQVRWSIDVDPADLA